MPHTSKNSSPKESPIFDSELSKYGNAFVHESAVIDEGAELGDGVKVWHFCHVMKNSRLGTGTSLGQNSFVASGVTTGSNCKIQNNVSLYQGVTLGDDVFLGPSCVFTNDLEPDVKKDTWDITQTIVKNGSSIGANATIVCGNTIGENSLVGAGSVVTKDVEPNTVVVGNPAKFLKNK